MAQVSERHHHMSQLGAAAVAPPGKQGSFPPPAPALYHFENEETTQPRVSEEPSEKHHHTSQLGETAVAPPGGVNGLPPPVPALHHLGDDHSAETQVGPSAIAPPTGEIVHPASIPAQYHLNEDEDKSNQSPIKPFQYHAQDQNSSSPNSRSAPPSDCHTSESQLGAAAIAAPSYTAKLPPPIPELHHIKDDHNHETQLGQPAIAPPASFVANPHQTNDVEEQEDLTFPGLLPFPKDIPTAPLLRISLAKLLSNDASETNKVWRASRDLGFFYLDLRNAESTSISGPSLLSDIDALFSLGEALFALPTPEKQKFDFVDKGSYFGYKGLGAGIIDKTGTRDRNEFYNVSKDDILGISSPLPAPDILQQQSSRDLLASYMQKSHAIVTLLLGILNTKLGLPENKLQSLHRLQAPSGDQARWVNTPAQPEDDRQKSLGEHTGTSPLSPYLLFLPNPNPQISHPNHSTQLTTSPTTRFRHPNPPLQPPRRPPNPSSLLPIFPKSRMDLRPPPAPPPNNQPRRRPRALHSLSPTLQHPPRSEPSRHPSG
jgi:hypothetical protein